VHEAEFALDLLIHVDRLKTARFAGLGVIFYRAPMLLPVIPLGSRASLPYDLPVRGLAEIGAVLSALADAGSPLHDGFHLVDVESKQLTHVAQFVAPPLPSPTERFSGSWPSGARQMTALLVSRLKSVATVGLLSNSEAAVYSDGVLTLSVPTAST
jgi:hypothetical protein